MVETSLLGTIETKTRLNLLTQPSTMAPFTPHINMLSHTRVFAFTPAFQNAMYYLQMLSGESDHILIIVRLAIAPCIIAYSDRISECLLQV